MEELQRINNVIIFDTKTEYTSNDIFENDKLTQVYNNVVILKGLPSLVNKINSENGIVYIHSNAELSVAGKIELRNVSQQLQNEYSKIAGE
ncbi:MAG: hypothetical protein E2590_07175 [Chryseobacterium sp.]|nr:hypothetical protein [Chryseobacterium sp.]